MKIAVTADCHLTTREAHPERYTALETLLVRLLREQIGHLIIAGDLFDVDQRNYSEFDALCKSSRFREIQIYVLPGNHDSQLTSKSFTASNLTIIESAELRTFDLMSRPVLLTPYQSGRTMGEVIASFSPELADEPWMLIGHGDWIGGLKEPNPHEPGVYMPLTKLDIETFKPASVILGHIHKPTEIGLIQYPGSLYPLDINETGRRRFLVLDSENATITVVPIFTDRLYFQTDLTILPLENESEYLMEQISSTVNEWNLTEEEKAVTEIRVRVHGYTTDKSALSEIIRTGFSGFTYYDPEGPDVTGVSLSTDRDLEEIARLTSKAVSTLQWPSGPEHPSRNDILIEALKTIYGD